MKSLSRFFYATIAAVAFVVAINAATSAQSQSGASLSEFDQPLKPIAPSDERLTGLIVPSKQVQLMAPLQGIIKEINVEENEAVKKDQVLGKIDDEIQKVTVEAAKLEIDRNRALLAEAELQVEQIERLAAKGATTDTEVRQRKLQRDGAAIDLKRSEAALDLEKLRLDLYQLKAPFDGRVLRIVAEAGAKMQADDVVLAMVALDPLEAHMYLPVQLYGELKVGQEYHFVGGPPVSKPLVGKLKTIEPQIEPASQTFRCVFTIDNPDTTLPAGFTVRFAWPQPTAE